MTSNFRTSKFRTSKFRGRPARAVGYVGVVAVLATVLSLTQLAAADAHVRVLPDSTATGSFSALTFRVPNESVKATTTKLSVQLPQNTPFLSVSARSVAGWRITSTEAALPKPVQLEGDTITRAVRTVTWTAGRGSALPPGEYQDFSLSVGPLPAPGAVLLPAIQTYSDGTVMHWNQPTPASGEEPENPVPELTVTAADPAPATAPRSDDTARLLGVGGLLFGAAGLALGLLGLRRRPASVPST